RDGGDLDLDSVKLRAADDRSHGPRRDLQIHDRTVSNVSTAAWQPVREVAVTLEVVAPGCAPERLGDLAAVDDDRQGVMALLLQRRQLVQRLKATHGDRHVVFPIV